jgi:hypothetical protein
MIDVFISHSSQDQALAERVVDLLRSALNLRADVIRCTSVDGYRLPVGADSDEQLRDEVLGARAFVGILSSMGLASAYVLFELGARWGVKKHLAPLLAHGMTAHALRGPIAGLNALSCESAAQLHQLVQDLGTALKIRPEAPQVYQAKIDGVVYSGAAVPAQPPVQRPTSGSSKAHETGASDAARAVRPLTEDEYADADAVIRHHCEHEWPDDFSMRAYCIQQQREAVTKLRRGGRPEDVSEDVFSGVRRKCAAEWPDDYAMRVYCEEQQLAGYRQVRET